MGAIISELSVCLLIASLLGLWIGLIMGCDRCHSTKEQTEVPHP